MSGTTARRRVLKVPVDGVAEHRVVTEDAPVATPS